MQSTILASVALLAGAAWAGPATPAQLPGYSAGIALGNAAIKAPYDKYGYDSFIESIHWSTGLFNASRCAEQCSSWTANSLAKLPVDGSPVQTCKFFNTYQLLAEGSTPEEQHCDLYSESWPAAFATTFGEYEGYEYFTYSSSEAYSNSTDAGSPSPAAAIYQAGRIINEDYLQPFCSAFLQYVPPPAVIAVPTILQRFPDDILSSACKLQQPTPPTPSPHSQTPTPTPQSPTPTPTPTSSRSATTPTTFSTSATTLKTSTASTLSVLSTASSSSTSSKVTPSPTSSCGNGYSFHIAPDSGASIALGYADTPANSPPYVSFGSNDPNSALSFTLDSSCSLTVASGPLAGYQATLQTGVRFGVVQINSPNSPGYVPLTCTIDSEHLLHCSAWGNTFNSEYNYAAEGFSNAWQLSDNAADASGASPITIVTGSFVF